VRHQQPAGRDDAGQRPHPQAHEGEHAGAREERPGGAVVAALTADPEPAACAVEMKGLAVELRLHI
jgi:hypothetical protein